jgi:hypothetical protein
MSGGTFDYIQYRITEIHEKVLKEIQKSGKKKTPEEMKEDYWYPGMEVNPIHYEHPKEVLDKFKEGYIKLREAQIYAQRIDWLLAGDDGEETFLKRLQEDLEKLYKEDIIKQFKNESNGHQQRKTDKADK